MEKGRLHKKFDFFYLSPVKENNKKTNLQKTKFLLFKMDGMVREAFIKKIMEFSITPPYFPESVTKTYSFF